MIRAGVLSDTHLTNPTRRFQEQIEQCFSSCDVIIHAGDITEPAVLALFGARPIYAVHGNMCSTETRARYPEQRTFTLGGFVFGLAHGARLGLDIESSLWNMFPEADCLIYGHTHRPTCHYHDKTLFLNPGSFQATGRYGAPGTYAILEIGEQCHAHLHEIPLIA